MKGASALPPDLWVSIKFDVSPRGELGNTTQIIGGGVDATEAHKIGGVRQWPEEGVVIHADLHEVLHSYDEINFPAELAGAVVAVELGADVEEIDLAVLPKVRIYDPPQLVPRQRQALKIREQAGVAKEVGEGLVHVDVVGREAPEAGAGQHVVLHDHRIGHVVVVDGERLERGERGEEAVGDVYEFGRAEVDGAEAGDRRAQLG